MKKVGCVRIVGGTVFVPLEAAPPARPSAETTTMAKGRMDMPRGPRNGSSVADWRARPGIPLQHPYLLLSTRFPTRRRGQSDARGSFRMPVDTDTLPARYRSPKRIARGGMGEIYRATDASLGRAVAVKVLAERYSRDDEVRRRFTREAHGDGLADLERHGALHSRVPLARAGAGRARDGGARSVLACNRRVRAADRAQAVRERVDHRGGSRARPRAGAVDRRDL